MIGGAQTCVPRPREKEEYGKDQDNDDQKENQKVDKRKNDERNKKKRRNSRILNIICFFLAQVSLIALS